MKGATRTPLDKRDRSYHRSYGTVAAPLPLKEYTYDQGFPIPSQITDGYPEGCRAYTLSHIAGNEDKAIYKPKYSCDKIAYIENTPDIKAGDIRTALKVGKVYGVQRLDETSDTEAETHRRGDYYSVDKVQGMDWFDSFRTALRNTGVSISTGSIWFEEFQGVSSDGILTSNFVFDGKWDTEAGHNYEICGEHIIGNQPYLAALPWEGTNFGDNGRVYFSREAFNRVFDIFGTCGMIQPPFAPKDIYTVKLDMLQFLLNFIGRILKIKWRWMYA